MPRLSAAAPHTVQMNVMASIGKSSFAVFCIIPEEQTGKTDSERKKTAERRSFSL